MQPHEQDSRPFAFLGIDVGKDHLDAAYRRKDDSRARARRRRFNNTPSGHRALIEWLGTELGTEPTRVCLEASGRYSIDVALALCETDGVAVMVAQPRAVKQFRDASMRRSKTDDLDAQLLCDYAERMPFEAYEPPETERVELRAITRRIQTLTLERSREQNRLHAEAASRSASRVVTNDIEVNIRHISRRIDRLVAQALALIEASDDLQGAFSHMTSIRGVGQKSALLLLGELGMLPDGMNVRQWVAYAGLDPKEHRSGTSVEKRPRISKMGNARIRRVLYMPALVAVQHETHVQAYYEKLIGRGKAPKVALVAVMRKLLHSVYGMLKHDCDFEGAKFYQMPENAMITA